MSNPILEAALSYAARGWRVFPLQEQSKEPATAHGFKDATTDVETIKRWFATGHANVAIATGNGLAVIDVDSLDSEWARTLPATFAVRTGKGAHLYYAGDVRNTVKLVDGVDVRGEGGYVVAAPSVHPDGSVYAVVDNRPLAPLPELPRQDRASAPTTDAPITEGHRNDAAFRDASAMRRRGMGQEAIVAAILADTRYQPPLPEAEVRDIAQRVAQTYLPDAAADAAQDWKERQLRQNAQPSTDQVERRPASDDELLLAVLSSVKLEASSDEPVAYLTVLGQPGFVVKGDSHILAAYPKAGKTELMAAVVNDWAANYTVLYFTEESRRTWNRRLKRLALPRHDFQIIETRGKNTEWMMRVMNAYTGKLIQDGAQPGAKPVVVIIDTIRLLGIEDENDSAGAERAFQPFVTFQQATGTTVIFIHHANKSAEDLSLLAIAGSHGFAGAVDNLVLIARASKAKGDPKRRIAVSGRSVEELEASYERQDVLTPNGIGTGRFKFVYLGKQGKLVDDTAERMKPLLVFQAWQTRAQLKDSMDGDIPSDDTIDRALTKLAEDGYAERRSGGKPGKAAEWRRK